jgi:hypothetical protein
MPDKEFLTWLRDRMVNVYGVNPHTDYIHKLNAIIESTPPDKVTLNT